MGQSEILRVMSRKMFPFLLLFGLYLISYGHLSPGGGFQGGVVVGSSVILLSLSHGLSMTERRLQKAVAEKVECALMLFIIGIGLVGIAAHRYFLSNFLPMGRVGSVASAGTALVLGIAIGIKVGAGMIALFYHLAKAEQEE